MTGYLSLPESAVVKADGLTLDQAAMVEFLAIGAHAVSRSGVGQGDRVLIVGAGPIGAAVAIFARASGANVTLLDARRPPGLRTRPIRLYVDRRSRPENARDV